MKSTGKPSSPLLGIYYSLFHRTKYKLMRLLSIPLPLGDYYYSNGMTDDIDRRQIGIDHAVKKPVKSYSYVDGKKIENKYPKQCNRYTNTPCSWSESHWSTDRCRKCGTVFPEWN